MTASRVGSVHRCVALELDHYSWLLSYGAAHMTEPIADWTAGAYLALTRACAEDGSRLLLTGHGPDELFLAYRWVRRALENHKTEAIPNDLMDAYATNPEYSGAARVAPWLYGRRLLYLCKDQFRHFEKREFSNYAASLQLSLMRGYLRSNGLAQLDGLGLLAGVEVRVPYVDYEFVRSVAGHSLKSGAHKKVLLEELAAACALSFESRPKSPFFPEFQHLTEQLRHWAASEGASGELVKSGFVRPDGLARLRTLSTRSELATVLLRVFVLESWIAGLHQFLTTQRDRTR